MSDIAGRRLRAQRLTGDRFASAADAVRWFGAVQAQDYGGAKWAVGQRVTASTDAALDEAVDSGAILRTHVMRPTWHFVAREDARWLVALTGARLRQWVAGRWRTLELDAVTVSRAVDLIAAALEGGRALTRAEVGVLLSREGIRPDGQRLPHLLMAAEADGAVISGPRQGRQPTWARLDERVPDRRGLDRESAVAELARRYFRGHGPAQARDFAWWSGLTQRDARGGIDAIRAELLAEVIEGQEYFSDAGAAPAPEAAAIAHLLPNFDEYTVGYRDREAALHPDHPFDPSVFAFGSILTNVVLVGGRVRGAWRRTSARGSLTIEVTALGRLRRPERVALESAAQELSAFQGLPVKLLFA